MLAAQGRKLTGLVLQLRGAETSKARLCGQKEPELDFETPLPVGWQAVLAWPQAGTQDSTAQKKAPACLATLWLERPGHRACLPPGLKGAGAVPWPPRQSPRCRSACSSKSPRPASPAVSGGVSPRGRNASEKDFGTNTASLRRGPRGHAGARRARVLLAAAGWQAPAAQGHGGEGQLTRAQSPEPRASGDHSRDCQLPGALPCPGDLTAAVDQWPSMARVSLCLQLPPMPFPPAHWACSGRTWVTCLFRLTEWHPRSLLHPGPVWTVSAL